MRLEVKWIERGSDVGGERAVVEEGIETTTMMMIIYKYKFKWSYIVGRSYLFLCREP